MLRAFAAFASASLLALTTAQPAYAQALEPADKTALFLSQLAEEDLSALIRFTLPSAFGQVQTACRAHLPSDSYMYQNAPILAQRFQSAAQGSAAGAVRVLTPLAAAGELDADMAGLFSRMPPEVVAPFISELISARLAPEITPETCTPINRTLELLDPLPAENMADLVSYLVIMLARDEIEKAPNTDG